MAKVGFGEAIENEARVRFPVAEAFFCFFLNVGFTARKWAPTSIVTTPFGAK